MSMPGRYQTNKIPEGGHAKTYLNYPPPHVLAQAMATNSELLVWLGLRMFYGGDHLGALLAALLLRHYDPTAKHLPGDLYWRLRQVMEADFPSFATPNDYLFAPFDALLKDLGSRVAPDTGSSTAPSP
jgi:hypothetical protein